MLREHSWWLDLVVITREHQDRDVDVEKTGRDTLRQTVFRPLQASFFTGAHCQSLQLFGGTDRRGGCRRNQHNTGQTGRSRCISVWR